MVHRPPARHTLTLRAARRSPAPVVGIGWDAHEAYRPHRVSVRGRPRRLLTAVRATSRRDDVVVVYLHWGTESESCPGPKQRVLARALAGAGADVVVGSPCP